MFMSLVIEKLFFSQNKNQHEGSFSQQRCPGGFAYQIRQEFNLSNVCTREVLRAKWYCHDSRHLAIEKCNQRPVAGDGIIGLLRKRFSKFIKQ